MRFYNDCKNRNFEKAALAQEFASVPTKNYLINPDIGNVNNSLVNTARQILVEK